MAISAAGIGSGLDVEGLITSLMSLEQRPLVQLQAKESSFQAKLSAYGQLKASLATLQSSASALTKTAKFSATTATVADPTILSATSGASATAGNYTIKVNNLATTQRTATSATNEFVPAAGDLTVTFGSIINGGFVPDGNTPATVNFAGGTLEDLRDAINDSDVGVSASVINNGTAKQLVLTSASTGADQAFSLSGSVGLNYLPTDTTTASDPVYGVQAAGNASLEVDGIAVSRSKNVIDDVIDGVTLNLKSAPSAATTLTIADDKSGAKSAIEGFVTSFNNLVATIKSLTAYDAEKDTAATLTGDATTRSVQNQLRDLLTTSISGLPGATRLGEIGITLTSTGTLSIDSEKLQAALNDPTEDVGSLFAGTDSVDGLAKRVSDRIDSFLDADGLISSRTDGINSSLKFLSKQEDAFNLRLEKIEARYRAQFTALDTLIASMNQTSTFLTQQLANLPTIQSSSN
ncbi:MAG: flagellar filament capping protein FliD [Zoogloeaceae bacterium]|nr:flagellar filament capping protein FliD [Zoogloeaceae bacterium]